MKETIRTPKSWRSSQALCSLLLVVMLSGLLPALPASAANGGPFQGENAPMVEASASSAAIPLEDLLAADGTLQILPGQHGSIDARGWRLVSQNGEAPRFAPQAPGDEQWWDGFHLNGLDGEVHALAFDNQGNLYAGGHFAAAGTVIVNNIARWDPLTATWSALGSGIEDGWNTTSVYAMAVDSSGNLYVGGDFTIAGGMGANFIACWDPFAQTWSGLGSGMSGGNLYKIGVYALALDGNGTLYAGGSFTHAGEVTALYIARWDPLTQSWSDLNGGMGGIYEYTVVDALAFDSNGNLYVGGNFYSGGGVSAHYIARWDPLTQTWSALGSGMNGVVHALAIDGSGNLYAGGGFTTAGGVSANSVARWDPPTATWSALGSGLDDEVFALALDGSENLYAGGNFTTAGGVSANCIARWDPLTQTWNTLGSGMTGSNYFGPSVRALAVDSSGNLHAGGNFATAGGAPVEFLARWDGAAWGALFSDSGEGGVTGFVYALVVDGSGNLYAGGRFLTAGGAIANGVAQWDPITQSWSALGSGTNHFVHALAVDSNGNLYAGGDFTTVGGIDANYIARWDPLTQTWSSLSGGMDHSVRALAFDNSGKLYVGGFFDTAGGVIANGIARWDPLTQTWSALGSGVSSNVYALAFDVDETLYVGGSFSTAGGMSANNIASWEPLTQTWSALGSGMNGIVHALAIDGSGNLYAGGWFTSAGGVNANSIAHWDPLTQTWSALGSGVSGTVYGLAVGSDGNLYVGGSFYTAGGMSAKGVARWDPLTATWSTLGSGVNDYVYALAIDGSGNLYAGGGFTTAGGKASSRIALWMPNIAPVADAGADQAAAEGQAVAFSGSYTDPGPQTLNALGTPMVAWDFGDGGGITGTLTPTHTYADNGIYTVTLVITDELGGAGMGTLLVTVENVAPALDPIADRSVVVGRAFTITAAFTDPGLLDTHSAVMDWGNGMTETLDLAAGLSGFDLAHAYTVAGVYTVTILLADDDGGQDVLAFTVVVEAASFNTWLPVVLKH